MIFAYLIGHTRTTAWARDFESCARCVCVVYTSMYENGMW